MKCDEFERRVQRMLDRRREPRQSAALARHALRCETCARTLRLYDALWDGFDMIEVPAPSADFSRRTVARAIAATPARRDAVTRWQSRVAAVIAVLAAAILLVVLVPPWRRDAQSPADHSAGSAAVPAVSPSSETNTARRGAAVAAVDPSPHARQKLDRGADRELPRDSASGAEQSNLAAAKPTVDVDGARRDESDPPVPVTMTMPPAYRDVIDGLTARLSEVPLEEIKNSGVTEGLRPLASPFSAAISLLRRTMAMGKEPAPDDPQAFSPEVDGGRTLFDDAAFARA